MNKFHQLPFPVTHFHLPEKFTYPFHYTPHPLCVAVAAEVQKYLQNKDEWKSDLEQGKMFGVLIVQTQTGETGYLAAFSGILAGKNLHDYFVPPIYDLQQPNGFFRIEEDQISAINARIKKAQTDKHYQATKTLLAETIDQAEKAICTAKEELKEAQQKREERRKHTSDENELANMIRESQFQKAELKRLKKQWDERISAIRSEAETLDQAIEQLKTERKTRSAALQQQLFEQFRILNGKGETKNLCEIFKETTQQVPPAGAGECAAPKLLQYAYLHCLKPVAMAEFWWGNSPKREIRHHGYFYPACKGKCEPILKHMLQGLNVEENPLLNDLHRDTELEILFEDNWLVAINKPAGMLSVPGKADIDSVYQRLKTRYPEATGPMIVHRLDMATSGILLVAKTKEVHQNLQAQFKSRMVKKRYAALLDGTVIPQEGIIDLPLCLDPMDRPRQIVSTEHGKPAITQYKVLAHNGNRTRIAFYPLTGRTHQLRVHASHPLGLNAPIIGDELYGKGADRLYLHAEFLEFRHPVSGQIIQIEKKAGF